MATDPMENRAEQSRWWHWGLIALFSAGCGSDSCIIPPCGPPTAIVIDVSAADAPNGVPGLRLTVNGALDASACTPGPIAHCYVLGTAGDYQLELNAVGYVPVKLGVTVAPATGGECGSCHQVETQQLRVIMQSHGT